MAQEAEVANSGRVVIRLHAATRRRHNDWNLEVGAMTRRSSGLPAPLFQKIKEYSQEYGLFGEVLNIYGRIAIAMEMDANTSVQELLKHYSRRKQSPMKPILSTILREILGRRGLQCT